LQKQFAKFSQHASRTHESMATETGGIKSLILNFQSRMQASIDSAEARAGSIDANLQRLRDSVTEQLKRTATGTDIARVEAEFENYCSYRHIQQLQEEVLPIVKAFDQKMNTFSQDHQDMKLCVRGFDKALCEKANKSSLNEIQEHNRAEFVRNEEWKALEAKLVEKEKERTLGAQRQRESFDQYRAGVADEIESLCTEITSRQLSQYDRVAKSFQKFFNQDELETILDRKADLELI